MCVYNFGIFEKIQFVQFFLKADIFSVNNELEEFGYEIEKFSTNCFYFEK